MACTSSTNSDETINFFITTAAGRSIVLFTHFVYLTYKNYDDTFLSYVEYFITYPITGKKGINLFVRFDLCF